MLTKSWLTGKLDALSFRYNIPNRQSNMAIMDIGVVSGFEAEKDKVEKKGLIKRIESASGRLIIYFDEVSLFDPFPNDKFFGSSRLKEFADDHFKFNENGRKFSKWVENTVGKGEIARFEQFLLQCFQKTLTSDT